MLKAGPSDYQSETQRSASNRTKGSFDKLEVLRKSEHEYKQKDMAENDNIAKVTLPVS